MKKYSNLLRAISIKAWLFALVLLSNINIAFAASTGKGALTDVTREISDYLPVVQTLMYTIAGIVAVVGAFTVYFKMQNEDQDVKKSIMLLIGSCIFLVAAATALPSFFGM